MTDRAEQNDFSYTPGRYKLEPWSDSSGLLLHISTWCSDCGDRMVDLRADADDTIPFDRILEAIRGHEQGH